jgi:hypothetical protein
MCIRKYSIVSGVGLLMSTVILAADLTVDKTASQSYEMDGSSAQSDNIMKYDAATVHGDISLLRYNAQANQLGIETAGTFSLGPDAGDAPVVTLYNQSWLETRCRLIAPTVEVGKNGGWGSFDVDGGSLQSKNFSVCASAAVPEGGLLLTLGKQKVSGKLYLYNLFNYATAGVRINFKGGLVRANYGGAAKLFNPVSGDIFLSSVNGEDIKIANENLYLELMLMNASSEYAGKLKTEGDGDFVVDGDFMIDGKGGSADAMFLMMGKNVKNTAVWGHKGDFVLKNHSVLFSADDTAPANENTGMIRLSGKDPEHPSLFKMDKYSQKVNGIVVADGEYGMVIAEAGAVLTVGLYKDGELTNVDLGTDVKIV